MTKPVGTGTLRAWWQLLLAREKHDTPFTSAIHFATIKPARDEWTWIKVAG